MVLILIAFIFVRNYVIQKRRVEKLTTVCAEKKVFYVFIEGQLGLNQDLVQNVSFLLDNADCPTRLQLHILEPVQSVREEDLLGKDLENACKLAPNYSTFFKESVFIHKIHRAKLDLTDSISHILSSLKKTIKDDDFILWIPPNARMMKKWDSLVRKDISDDIVVWPLSPPIKYDIERYFYTEIPEANFFVVGEDFQYEPRPMARPGIVKSCGISFRHPLGTKKSILVQLVGAKTDFDLSFKAFSFKIMNGAGALGFAERPAPNRKRNLDYMPEDENWKTEQGIDEEIYGRAMLGMTLESSIQEILVKYGSEVNFEREKEALQFG